MPRGMDRSGHAREVPHHRGQLSQGYEGLRAGEQSSPNVSSIYLGFLPLRALTHLTFSSICGVAGILGRV